MPKRGRQFTQEERSRGGKARAAKIAKSKAKLAEAAAGFTNERYQSLTEEQRADRLQEVLWSIADDPKAPVRARIAAATNLLPYVMAKIKAQELELDGRDPININEDLIAQNHERHGHVDPAEFMEAKDERSTEEAEGAA